MEEFRVEIVLLNWKLVDLLLLPFIKELWCEYLLSWRVFGELLFIHLLSWHEHYRLLNIFNCLTNTLILSFLLRHLRNRWIRFWTCSSKLAIFKKKRSICLMTPYYRKSIVHWRLLLVEGVRILMLLQLLAFVLAKAWVIVHGCPW